MGEQGSVCHREIKSQVGVIQLAPAWEMVGKVRWVYCKHNNYTTVRQAGWSRFRTE